MEQELSDTGWSAYILLYDLHDAWCYVCVANAHKIIRMYVK